MRVRDRVGNLSCICLSCCLLPPHHTAHAQSPAQAGRETASAPQEARKTSRLVLAEGLQTVRDFAIPEVGSYSGEMLNGQPQGHGTMRFEDGRVYVDSFVRRCRHGRGKENCAQILACGEYVLVAAGLACLRVRRGKSEAGNTGHPASSACSAAERQWQGA